MQEFLKMCEPCMNRRQFGMSTTAGLTGGMLAVVYLGGTLHVLGKSGEAKNSELCHRI